MHIKVISLGRVSTRYVLCPPEINYSNPRIKKLSYFQRHNIRNSRSDNLFPTNIWSDNHFVFFVPDDSKFNQEPLTQICTYHFNLPIAALILCDVVMPTSHKADFFFFLYSHPCTIVVNPRYRIVSHKSQPVLIHACMSQYPCTCIRVPNEDTINLGRNNCTHDDSREYIQTFI